MLKRLMKARRQLRINSKNHGDDVVEQTKKEAAVNIILKQEKRR